MKSAYINKLKTHIKNELTSTLEGEIFTCIKCGKTLDENKYICDACKNEMTYTPHTNCVICGRLSLKILCEYCMVIKKPYSQIYYCFPYDNFAKQSFVSFKEHGNMLYGRMLTELITRMYNELNIPQADIVTNVPAHFIRPILRLCDPPKKFAKSISNEYNIPYKSCLKRISNKHADRKSSRDVRMNVAKDNFIAKDVDLSGKKVLLIDDVITTGATTHVCTQALKDKGADKVYVLSLCCVLSE